MTAFSLISLIFLCLTATCWSYISSQWRKTRTKPIELLVLKTDKWTPRVNYAASILFLISAFMQIITVSIRLYQTLMN